MEYHPVIKKSHCRQAEKQRGGRAREQHCKLIGPRVEHMFPSRQVGQPQEQAMLGRETSLNKLDLLIQQNPVEQK